MSTQYSVTCGASSYRKALSKRDSEALPASSADSFISMFLSSADLHWMSITEFPAMTCGDGGNFSGKSGKFNLVFPNLFQENVVLGEETISLTVRSVDNL